MIPNRDPETNVRYGVIAMQSLEPWLWDEITSKGTSLTLETFVDECHKEYAAMEDDVKPEDFDAWLDDQMDDYQPEEERWRFSLDGVHGEISWLGGAPLMFVFSSQHVTHGVRCSPCVPNAVDLDGGPGEYEGYDVPDFWYSSYKLEDPDSRIAMRLAADKARKEADKCPRQ